MNTIALAPEDLWFVEQLRDIITGVEIEGKSGFVNLFHIKKQFMDGKLRRRLLAAIEASDISMNDKRHIYAELIDFFTDHFSQVGCIQRPSDGRYDAVVASTDKNGVSLLWNHKSFIYVKSDRLWKTSISKFSRGNYSLEIVFDVSEAEHKSGNEKCPIAFTLKEVSGNRIIFCVKCSSTNQTDYEEILRSLEANRIHLSRRELKSILSMFTRRRSVDYFLHANAREFLMHQLNLALWNLSQTDSRLKPSDLEKTKYLGNEIIQCISKFEDMIVALWNKPKCVLNSDYVVTLDRICKMDGGTQLLRAIHQSKEFSKQIAEWIELGLVESAEVDTLNKALLSGDLDLTRFKHLPLDTQFLSSSLKTELLALFDNLEDHLDGWLVHSENYQALRTLLPKFQERIRLIYIDPPFNLGMENKFQYSVNYQDSVWLTLLDNRLRLAREFLDPNGSIFVRCDHNGNMYVRLLLNEIFGRENFRNEIVIRRGSPKAGLFNQFTEQKSLGVVYDNLYWYSKTPSSGFPGFKGAPTKRQRLGYWSSFKKIYDRPKMRYELLGINITKGQWMWKKEKALQAVKNYEEFLQVSRETGISLKDYWDRTGRQLSFVRRHGDTIQYWVAPRESVLLDNCWVDIPGYSSRWGFKTENSEVLLKRIIESTTEPNDLVMDFFLGSGTTVAVAHKLGRRWIGVEMGDHFFDIVLPRMKRVLAYDEKGIGKQVKEYTGGGFFKYYSLETFDHCLARLRMNDGEVSGDLYSLGHDEKSKQTHSWSIIHPAIDPVETVSNLFGAQIRRIGHTYATLDNGFSVSLEHFLSTDLISLLFPFANMP